MNEIDVDGTHDTWTGSQTGRWTELSNPLFVLNNTMDVSMTISVRILNSCLNSLNTSPKSEHTVRFEPKTSPKCWSARSPHCTKWAKDAFHSTEHNLLWIWSPSKMDVGLRKVQHKLSSQSLKPCLSNTTHSTSSLNAEMVQTLQDWTKHKKLLQFHSNLFWDNIWDDSGSFINPGMSEHYQFQRMVYYCNLI